MANIGNKTIASTYPDLLHLYGGTAGEGITNGRKRIFDGDGTGSPLWMGSNSLEMTGTSVVSGTLNLQEKSSQPSNPTVGDLAYIDGDLYIAK